MTNDKPTSTPDAALSPVDAGFAYAAFISYSHAADGKLAPALQKGLQSFAKPFYVRRAIAVFRDETNLSVSPGLWASIEQALGASKYFVLLASPQAAASKWVAREIEFWLKNRSPQTLLIVQTDGDLAWDATAGDFNWTRTSAIPHSLSRAFPEEPLFCDLRWARTAVDLSLENPSFRDKVAELSSALRGVSKDEIIGEDLDQHRRATRFRRFMFTALAVFLVGAVTAAIIARQEQQAAVRQRDLAMARTLSARSDLAREQNRSGEAAMLATEAVRIVASLGESPPEVDLALRRSLAAFAPPVNRFEESPDAKLMLARDGQSVIARFGTPDTRLSFWNLRAPVEAKRIVWSDGKYHVHAGANLVGEFEPEKPSWLCASTPDGRYVVLRADDGSGIEVWALDPVHQITSWQVAAGQHECDVSADGRLVALTTTRFDRAVNRWLDPSTVVWNVRRREPVLSVPGRFLSFSLDGVHLATDTGVWRYPVDEPAGATPVSAFPEPVRDVRFSRNGRYVASRASLVGPVEIGDADIPMQKVDRSQPPIGRLLGVSDDGDEVIIGGHGTEMWNVRFRHTRARIALEALDAAFEGKDVLILVSSLEAPHTTQMVQVLKAAASGASGAVLDLDRDERVSWLRFGRHGELFALVTGQDLLRIDAWHWAEGRRSVVVNVPVARQDPRFAFDAGTEHYAIAGRGEIAVGRMKENADPVRIPVAEHPAVLALSATGEFLAVGRDGALDVWDVAHQKRSVLEVAGTPVAARVSRDGSVARCLVRSDRPASRAGSEYDVQQWAVQTRSITAQVAAGRRGDNFSPAELSDEARDLYYADDGDVGEHPASRLSSVGPPTNEGAHAEVELYCASSSGPMLRVTVEDGRVKNSDAVVVNGKTGATVARLEHGDAIDCLTMSDDDAYVASQAANRIHVWPISLRSLLEEACARWTDRVTSKEWQRLTGEPAKQDACGRPFADDVNVDPSSGTRPSGE